MLPNKYQLIRLLIFKIFIAFLAPAVKLKEEKYLAKAGGSPGYPGCWPGSQSVWVRELESKTSQEIRAAADISQSDRKPELGFWPEPVIEDSKVKTEVQTLIMVGTG